MKRTLLASALAVMALAASAQVSEKADIESESRAAAFGGVTSYFEMPNTVTNQFVKRAKK